MKSILIIDDDDAVRGVIRELLKVRGFEVLEASGGRQGLDSARTRHPDLIICDVIMPEFDGYATVAAMRGDPGTADIPIILLTGQTGQTAMRQGMSLGADDFLTKPFKPEELYAAIQTRLDRAQTMAEQTSQKLADLRGRITHVLPHELRTPLQSILGFADILAEEYNTLPREEIGETARMILGAAKRLNRLTENFLVYAQIEVIASTPEALAEVRQEVCTAPAEAISEVAERLGGEYNRGDDLAMELENCAIAISRDNLEKVVSELVSNALKFSPANTPVALLGHAGESEYVLQIYNQGRGMTPAQISSIGAYMQFGRQEHEQQGAGLGLFIAKRLVELHAGKLEIASVPDKETTVMVTLCRPGR